MADRLDRIKAWAHNRRGKLPPMPDSDFDWLITEVDRLRKVEVQYELIPAYMKYTGPDPTPNPRPVDRDLTRAQEAGYEPF